MIERDSLLIEYLVIGTYMVLLVIMGWIFRRLSSNDSDYFRLGCQGTWWLVGTSAFISTFSAWTFTGLAGVGFEAGWTFSWIFIAQVIGLLINAAIFAPWFRQMRVVTLPEAIRGRFNAQTQQFYAWIVVVSQTLGAAMQLYALAIFTSVIFGFSIESVLIVVGIVVLLYSLTGGSWAVMATDFLQGVILIPTTVLITILCLMEIGGIGGFFQAIEASGLREDFGLFKDMDHFDANRYSWFWIIGYLLHTVTYTNSIIAGPKYFGVKDGKDARKAAFLAAGLMFFGILIWCVPPMVARLLFEDAVMSVGISKPAEASFAVVSLALLPAGMTGLVVVTMFAATMSSMDTGLNRNAAIITRDILPVIYHLLGVKEPSDKLRFKVARICTLFMGISVLSLALYFSSRDDGAGVFTIFLTIGALLSVPLSVPMLWSMLIRNVPSWAAIVSVMAALIPSTIGFFSARLFGEPWNYQTQIFANVGVGSIVFFATMPFWKYATAEYKQRVDVFFEQMHRPVRFADEVGEDKDLSQLRIIGGFTVIVGLFISSLLLIPNSLGDRIGILFVAGFAIIVGSLMLWLGYRAKKRVLKTLN